MNLTSLTIEEVFAIYRNESGKLRRGLYDDRPRDYTLADACRKELFNRLQPIYQTISQPSVTQA